MFYKKQLFSSEKIVGSKGPPADICYFQQRYIALTLFEQDKHLSENLFCA
jgi:hypothetical protein